MKKYLIFTVLWLTFSTATAAGSVDRTETDRLHAWLDNEFEEYLDFLPMSRSRLGDKSAHGELRDASLAGNAKILAWRRASVDEMRGQFDRSKLNEQGKISWDLWEYLLARSEAGVPWQLHSYIFGRRGPHTSLPNSLMNYHKVDTAADLEAYINRLSQVDRYLGQYLARAKLSSKKGVRAPYFDYQLATAQSERVITGAPFTEKGESSLMQDFRTKASALEAAGLITEKEARAFEARASKILVNEVLPAYQEIIAWLKADATKTSEAAEGAWALPDGLAYYQYTLERNTTLPLTAEEIHRLGLAEVARIHDEMRQIKNTVKFDGDLKAFFDFMRDAPEFYFPSTDEGREKYINLATGYIEAMEQELPGYFGILPKADLVVRRVEAFREQPGGAAHYQRGTPDGERPGVFYAHLIDMSAAAVYRLENLSYHEGLPGHHLQLSIQQELEGVPRFRTFHGFTAYSEGWGLYSELLAKDMGFYKDPYSDFGRLTGELWRAVRLVVDTGMHALRWTEQQAIDYASQNSPNPPVQIKSEVHRYFNNPAQATAYKIGMLKIVELRDHARQVLGDKFDYRGFHDTVLGSGPLPLSMLEARVNTWISSQMTP